MFHATQAVWMKAVIKQYQTIKEYLHSSRMAYKWRPQQQLVAASKFFSLDNWKLLGIPLAMAGILDPLNACPASPCWQVIQAALVQFPYIAPYDVGRMRVQLCINRIISSVLYLLFAFYIITSVARPSNMPLHLNGRPSYFNHYGN